MNWDLSLGQGAHPINHAARLLLAFGEDPYHDIDPPQTLNPKWLHVSS